MDTYLIDSTLRDGEQAPGVAFTLTEKLRIAEMLHRLGIEEIEAGTPAMGEKEVEDIRSIVKCGFNFRVTSWCRSKETDIKAAVKTQSQGISISFPLSDLHQQLLGKDRKWVLDQLVFLTGIARDYFGFVAVGAQDASRADVNFLDEFIYTALEQGVRRIRIADTVGKMDPFAVCKLMSRLTSRFPSASFEFHGHNDLGMATANTLAALRSGSVCASMTVNGIGERAGNAALEEVIMALKVIRIPTRLYNTKMLAELCRFVARTSNIPIHKNKPVTGENAFLHESGIHVNWINKNKMAYQAYEEKDAGVISENIAFGKHSGHGSIVSFFRKHNLPEDVQIQQQMLKMIKHKAQLEKQTVKENEILEMYHSLNTNLVKNVQNE